MHLVADISRACEGWKPHPISSAERLFAAALVPPDSWKFRGGLIVAIDLSYVRHGGRMHTEAVTNYRQLVGPSQRHTSWWVYVKLAFVWRWSLRINFRVAVNQLKPSKSSA